VDPVGAGREEVAKAEAVVVAKGAVVVAAVRSRYWREPRSSCRRLPNRQHWPGR